MKTKIVAGFIVLLASALLVYEASLSSKRNILIDESKPPSIEHAQEDILTPEPPMPVILSVSRAHHILYGDARGGGHKYGVGKPCKSEFPADWDDQEIIDTTKQIAANDTVDWRREDNGYFVGEKLVEGVNVRVVLGADKREVITSYPINVKRNPCPANDN